MEIKEKPFVIILLLVIIVNSFLVVAVSISSTTSTQFFNSIKFPYCHVSDEDPFASYWVFDDVITSSQSDCYNESGVGLDGMSQKKCCPRVATLCNKDTGLCSEGPSSCSEIFDETECNEADPRLTAENDIEPIIGEGVCNTEGGIVGNLLVCREYSACYCEWGSDECLSILENQTRNPSTGIIYNHLSDQSEVDDICGVGIILNKNCAFSFTVTDNCDTIGFINRGWTANWTGAPAPAPSYCKLGEDRIPCLDVVRLGFFNWINIIIVILVIVIIYYFLKKYKK